MACRWSVPVLSDLASVFLMDSVKEINGRTKDAVVMGSGFGLSKGWLVFAVSGKIVKGLRI